MLVKSDGSSFSLCQPVSSCRQVGRGTVRVGAKASGARSVVPPAREHSDCTSLPCPADGERVLVVLLKGR